MQLDIAVLARIGMYNKIQNHIQIHKPSQITHKYFPQIIKQYLKNKKLSKQNMSAVHKYLASHPIRILVPLCGCSYDLYHIAKYLQNEYGLKATEYKIIGIELSSVAIIEFFKVNQMLFKQSSYNPKYMIQPNFYRIEIYSNIKHNIHIIKNDIFEYYKLCKHLKEEIKINESPCLIPPESIDIIIDINAMSCIDPSDRNLYVESMKYWLKDKGQMLLTTHCYDAKLSNCPPYAADPKDIKYYFGDKCDLVDTKETNEDKTKNEHETKGKTKDETKNENEDDIDLTHICHTWIINK